MSIAVVDLSSYLHRYHHAMRARGQNASGDATVDAIDAFVNVHGDDGVAVCCDCPGVSSWRRALFEGYKAGRPPWDEDLIIQHDRVKTELGRRYAVLSVDGFEADDLIATVVDRASSDESPDEVVIASTDKDVCCLVNGHVSVFLPFERVLLDPHGVLDRYGVLPHQMQDFLCLVGDKTDGYPGVPGIGAVKAAKLLKRWGSLANVFRETLSKTPEECKLKPATHAAIVNGVSAAGVAQQLVALRTDCPVDFSSIVRKGSSTP